MIRPRIFLAVIAPLIAGVLCLLQAHAQMGPLLGVEGKWTKDESLCVFHWPSAWNIYTDATVCQYCAGFRAPRLRTTPMPPIRLQPSRVALKLRSLISTTDPIQPGKYWYVDRRRLRVLG
jgi:hypothetical protein